MNFRSDAQRKAMFANMFKKKDRFVVYDDETGESLDVGDPFSSRIKPIDVDLSQYISPLKYRNFNDMNDYLEYMETKVVPPGSISYDISGLKGITVSNKPVLDEGVNYTQEQLDAILAQKNMDKQSAEDLSKGWKNYGKMAETLASGEQGLVDLILKQEEENLRIKKGLADPLKRVEQEHKLKILKEATKKIEAETAIEARRRLLDAGVYYGGMGARMGLGLGKSVAMAPIHVAGRIVTPPIRGTKSILTAPARVLGSAVSGLKGTVGFAGQEAASVLHDMGIAANVGLANFGAELGQAVKRASSAQGFTRQISDPFLRQYHGRTNLMRPIGGFDMPVGARRFEPRSWG